MVALAYIQEWRDSIAPWQESYQVEQDLIISRILIALFSDGYLKEHLAFRGGTALHKLYLQPAPRYSEDVDLVQIKTGPIKPIMQRIEEVIDFFNEPRSTSHRGHGIKALYRFQSELEQVRYRIKLEINCKEQQSVFPIIEYPFVVKSGWFNGTCDLRTYNIHELLGSKLRALYQRKKGRDLFDIDYARRNMDLDLDKIIHCFKQYITESTGKKPPSNREFFINLEAKMTDKGFTGDIEGILRPGIIYNQDEAFHWISDEIISKL